MEEVKKIQTLINDLLIEAHTNGLEVEKIIMNLDTSEELERLYENSIKFSAYEDGFSFEGMLLLTSFKGIPIYIDENVNSIKVVTIKPARLLM